MFLSKILLILYRLKNYYRKKGNVNNVLINLNLPASQKYY